MRGSNQTTIKSHVWGVVVVGAARENMAKPGSKGSGSQKGHVPSHSREERAAELGCGGGTRNS